MITIENADKALKTYYLEAVSAQLDCISPFYAAIEKNSSQVYGKEVKLAVVRSGGAGVYAGAEDGDLPEPSKNRYITLTSQLKNIYGTIEISDKALRASQNSEGAFVNLLNAEMEGLLSCAKINFSRMLYGDGNGYISSIEEADGQKLYVDTVGRFSEGMRVDMRSLSAEVEGGSDLTVTAVDYSEGYIELSSLPDGTLEGKMLYAHGAYGNEITGFRALFGTDDIYGLERSGESFLNPAQFNVGELTEEAIMDKISYLEEFYNNRPDMLLCSYRTRAKIAALLLDSRQQVNTTVLTGGYSAILFDGIPVVADRYCGDDVIYLVKHQGLLHMPALRLGVA